MNGSRNLVVVVSVVTAMLTSCATTEQQPTSASVRHAGANQQPQLNLHLASGVYTCELGQSVTIQRNAGNAKALKINWQGNPYTLQRYDSSSGLPRYEDRQNSLLWIDLPWKGVLMDLNSKRPLANECKATSS